MNWMLLPLKRYADFNGRSGRREFWMFTLGLFLFGIVGGAVIGILGQVGTFLFGLAYLGILVPALAVQVRRFHDRDMSGWFVLLALVPIVGGLFVLVMMCLEGTPGTNRFGPNPYDMGVAELGEVFR